MEAFRLVVVIIASLARTRYRIAYGLPGRLPVAKHARRVTPAARDSECQRGGKGIQQIVVCADHVRFVRTVETVLGVPNRWRLLTLIEFDGHGMQR